MAKSQWSFETATELSAALAAKKVSAVELAQDVDRPHRTPRRQDQRDLRARFRPRPGSRPRRRCRPRARRDRPLLGIPMTVKESYNVAGLPTTWGFPAQKDFVPAGRRAVDIARQGGRRRHPRQDQRAARARRLAELQRDLRHHQQSVRSRPHARAAPPADRRRRWRRVTVRSRSVPISAARCACRRFTAASMPTSRPSRWCRRAAIRRRRCRRCRSTAISR